MLFLVESYDENGKLVIKNQTVSFIVGEGGFGGPRNSDKVVPCIKKPNRKPDISVVEKTGVDQAAIYRLSGN